LAYWLEDALDQGTFFQLNRLVVANFVCCKSYSNSGNGKLQVELSLTFSVPKPVIIYKHKAPKFKGWKEKVKAH
jgi:hypothetical protein